MAFDTIETKSIFMPKNKMLKAKKNSQAVQTHVFKCELIEDNTFGFSRS